MVGTLNLSTITYCNRNGLKIGLVEKTVFETFIPSRIFNETDSEYSQDAGVS